MHVGHYKTGTTALQEFCHANDTLLVDKGVSYIQARRYLAKHSPLAFCLLAEAGVQTLMHGYCDTTKPEQIWQPVLDEIKASPCKRQLISSEEFIRLAEHPKAMQALKRVLAGAGKGIRLRVVLYLRNPADHLPSWYNQMVKMKAPVPNYPKAVAHTMEEVHLDYSRAVAPWRDAFGADALIVRPYHDGLREGRAMFADFCGALDVPPPKGGKWTWPGKKTNLRMDDRLMGVGRVLGLLQTPRAQADWVIARAQKFLDTEAEAMVFPDRDIAGVTRRAQAGLDGLFDLTSGAIDPKALGWQVPDAATLTPSARDAAQEEIILALAVALREQNVQREALSVRLNRLNTRLLTLEKAAGFSQEVPPPGAAQKTENGS